MNKDIVFSRSDFYKTPNGKRPPYLMAIVEQAEDILGSKFGSLFRHKETDKVGTLMYVDRNLYLFDRPEIHMNRHGLGERAQVKAMSFYGWQEVVGALELYVDWRGGATFPLGSEEGPLKDLNDLLC